MSDENEVPYLHTSQDKVAWDWWHENPVEIVLVVFILVFFFALPREGCGVTPVEDVPASEVAPPATKSP